MFRRLNSDHPGLLLAGLLLCLAIGAPSMAAGSPSTVQPVRVVKDATLAKVLGEALFRDTVDVISASPSTSQVSASQFGPGRSREANAARQVVRTLLAHRPLEKYLWLIQQSFDDSLWKGAGHSQVERNFPLIWRTSIMLYESSLDPSPARERVCTPNDSGDGFDCSDALEPARIVPIPSELSVVISQNQAATG